MFYFRVRENDVSLLRFKRFLCNVGFRRLCFTRVLIQGPSARLSARTNPSAPSENRRLLDSATSHRVFSSEYPTRVRALRLPTHSPANAPNPVMEPKSKIPLASFNPRQSLGGTSTSGRRWDADDEIGVR